MTIEKDALRYQWIKAQTNFRLSSTRGWWLNIETKKKDGSRFSGVEHLDDLIDQAMKLYPITDPTL